MGITYLSKSTILFYLIFKDNKKGYESPFLSCHISHSSYYIHIFSYHLCIMYLYSLLSSLNTHYAQQVRLVQITSARITAGLLAKALAMATLCCCPPESSSGYFFLFSQSPRSFKSSFIYWWSTCFPLSKVTGRVMLSYTFKTGIRL